MKSYQYLLIALLTLTLSECRNFSTVVPSSLTPTPKIIGVTPTLPTKTLSDWCTSLSQSDGLPANNIVRNSNIVYLGSNFETGKFHDQVWKIFMGDGSEKLLLDDIPSPFLGIELLSDKYHFILAGSYTMISDLDGSALKDVDNIDDLMVNFPPYSHVWNLLSSSPEAKDAGLRIFHSPNGTHSAIWEASFSASALSILDKKNQKRTEVIYAEAPDSIQMGSWSPDGKYYAFPFYKNAKPYYSQVYIVSADGTDMKPLSQPLEHEFLDHPPVWSPDGEKIAIPFLGADGWEHFVITNYMTGKTMNYRVSPIIKTDSIQGQEMDWSPDGKWLAYISQYGHYGIELLDTESGKIYCGLDNNKISIKMLDWR